MKKAYVYREIAAKMREDLFKQFEKNHAEVFSSIENDVRRSASEGQFDTTVALLADWREKRMYDEVLKRAGFKTDWELRNKYAPDTIIKAYKVTLSW